MWAGLAPTGVLITRLKLLIGEGEENEGSMGFLLAVEDRICHVNWKIPYNMMNIQGVLSMDMDFGRAMN